MSGLHVARLAIKLSLLVFIFTYTQIAFSNSPVLVISGDSIAESVGSLDIGRCRVVNIGKGGAGVADVIEIISSSNISDADALIIEVGVNDAKPKDTSGDFYEKWESRYIELVRIAKKRAGSVYLSTVLQTEPDGGVYGSYADSDIIEQLNAAIVDIAKKETVHLLDAHSHFSRLPGRLTKDGLHPNARGHFELVNFWLSGVTACAQ